MIAAGGQAAEDGSHREVLIMNKLATEYASPERRQRIAEGLRIWARALGCSPSQVADTVCRAGLPIEKLWNSLNVSPRGR